ncbi:MAG: pyruvate kinase [Verrucomicrobia bacterium]|nr:pyruvate kinase [Verrucomicrobiota bacterium]
MSSTFRRTKIIFTLGPATESEEMLEKMIRAGADVARLNMAHAKHEWCRMVIRRIRAVSAKVGREIAIMMDIKGPEIRTGDVDHPILLEAGQIFDFTVRPGADPENGEEIRSVNVNYRDLVNDIKVGDTVLVDSGLIRLSVLEKHDTRIRCRVLTPGELKSRRHINLPGVKVNLPAFTDKDRADTLVGIEEGIDFVALSFVREGRDVEELRKFLQDNKSSAQIIAKIEDQSAILNLDDIVRATDSLMVARGDLGIECPYEDLPSIQRRAVNTCIAHGKSVIIATHMLESMITQPIPTRAEITDVANAVHERADCVMLSGETTVGKYPLDCVAVFQKVAARVEVDQVNPLPYPAHIPGDKYKLLAAAVRLADEMPNASLLTFTRRGSMSAGLAAMRPVKAPIYAMTNSVETLRKCRILRAVEPMFLELDSDPNETIEKAISLLLSAGLVKIGDTMIVATDILTNDRLVDSIQVRHVR